MTMTPWASIDPVPVLGLCHRLERPSRVRDAAAEVGAPVVRAEEPFDDESADPADGSRDLVGLGQKRALAVRLDLVQPDQRSGETVGLTA